jgi:hypothetical protein
MSRFVLIINTLICAILLPASCSGEDVEIDTSGRTSLIRIKKLGVSVVVNDPTGDGELRSKNFRTKSKSSFKRWFRSCVAEGQRKRPTGRIRAF